jgi:3-isopropylmalate/(R)-2-methylmalate dehydratase small subunit
VERFTTLTAVAAPLIEDDVNTDQIAPLQMQRSLEPDYAALLFARQRRRPDGSEIADFVLNRPQFRNPGILVSGHNFGCGSSREGAVWAMRAIGIRCVIARSLADIFRENILQNGMLPVELREEDADAFTARVIAADGGAPFTVDLETQRISGPGGGAIGFDIAASDRMRLLEGLDDIGLTLKCAGDIAAWEARTASAQPWLQRAVDRRHSGGKT